MKDIVVKITADNKNFDKSVKKTKQGFKDIGKEAKTSSQLMQKAGAAVTGFFGANLIKQTVTGLVNVNKELFEIGVKAQGVEKAFSGIANANLKDMRIATKGTVSDLDLMQKTVQGVKLGLDAAAMPELFQFAAQTAKDTGQEIDHLVESIVTGIGRKSPLILDNLGISAIQLKQKLNGVSMEAASVADVTRAVAEIAQDTMNGVNLSTKDTADAYNILLATFDNIKAEGGEMLVNSAELRDVILELTDSIVKNAPSILTFITDWGVGAAKIATTMVDIAGTTAQYLDWVSKNPLKALNPFGYDDYKKFIEDSKKTAIQLQQDVVKESKKAWKEALDNRDEQILKIEEKEKRHTVINKKAILDSLKLKEDAAFAEMDRQKKLLDGMIIMEKRQKKRDEEEKKRQEELNALKLKGEQDALNLAKQKKDDAALMKFVKPLTEFDYRHDVSTDLNVGTGFGEKSSGLFSSSAMKMDLEKNQEFYEQLGDVTKKQSEYLVFKIDMDAKVAKIEIDAATRQADAAELTKQKMYEMSVSVVNSMNGIYNVLTNESLNTFGKGAGILQSVAGFLPGGELISAGAGFLGNVFGRKEEKKANSSGDFASDSGSLTAATRPSATVSKQADTINNYYSFTNQVENLVGSGGMSELAQIITAEQKEATASFA